MAYSSANECSDWMASLAPRGGAPLPRPASLGTQPVIKFGEQNCPVRSVKTVLAVEVAFDGGRGRGDNDIRGDPVQIDALTRVHAVVEPDVCKQSVMFFGWCVVNRLLPGPNLHQRLRLLIT
jgi:hypothetical protein